MSAIIDNAASLRLERQVSIAQSKSQSGRRQAMRRSPLLYNVEVSLVPMVEGSARHIAIEDEILDSNYSTNLIVTKIPTLTKPRGLLTGTPLIKGANQAGNSIIIDGASANRVNWARKGDFVKFNGLSKLFQLTADANSSTDGTVTLKLNGAIPVGGSPADNSTVTFGTDVEGTFALVSRPEPTFSNGRIVNYSSALLEEVIT